MISPLAVALLLVSPQQEPDWNTVEVKAEKVAGNIYVLTGRGGNIGVSVGDDGVFLVDDQYAPLTDKVKAAVATISDKPIRFLLNTHWHGDHTGGNENLGKAGVVIVAHENVRRRMSVEQFLEVFNDRVPAAPGAHSIRHTSFTTGMTPSLLGMGSPCGQRVGRPASSSIRSSSTSFSALSRACEWSCVSSQPKPITLTRNTSSRRWRRMERRASRSPAGVRLTPR